MKHIRTNLYFRDLELYKGDLFYVAENNCLNVVHYIVINEKCVYNITYGLTESVGRSGQYFVFENEKWDIISRVNPTK